MCPIMMNLSKQCWACPSRQCSPTLFILLGLLSCYISFVPLCTRAQNPLLRMHCNLQIFPLLCLAQQERISCIYSRDDIVHQIQLTPSQPNMYAWRVKGRRTFAKSAVQAVVFYRQLGLWIRCDSLLSVELVFPSSFTRYALCTCVLACLATSSVRMSSGTVCRGLQRHSHSCRYQYYLAVFGQEVKKIP